MKYFFVFLTFVALTHADGDWVPKTDDQISVIRSECVKEVPLSVEQITKISQQLEFPDEEAVRKFMLCIVQNLGIFSKHEGYNADRFAKQFNMDLDQYEGCFDKNEQGSPTDVWSFRGQMCLDERAKQLRQQHKNKN